jgi:hypothetical protein
MIDAVVVHPCTEGDLMNALSQSRRIGYREDSDGPTGCGGDKTSQRNARRCC